MFFIRFCAALTSAYIFNQWIPNPAVLIWRYSNCVRDSDDFCQSYELWYLDLALAWNVISVVLWLAVWVYLELRTRKRTDRTPRVLTHLRYGPIATLLVAIVAIVVSDAVLIQYSRWKIVQYIHSNASPLEHPNFKLHNNYRHWCGNGWAAAEYDLYGATPAAYIDSPDPAVRARALQASMSVYDWINHPGNGPSMVVLEKALKDPEPLVSNIALEYRAELGGDAVIADTNCLNP